MLEFTVVLPKNKSFKFIFELDFDLDLDLFAELIEGKDFEPEILTEEIEKIVKDEVKKSMVSIKRRITRELAGLGYIAKWQKDKLKIIKVEEDIEDIEEDIKECLQDAVYNAIVEVVVPKVKKRMRVRA